MRPQTFKDLAKTVLDNCSTVLIEKEMDYGSINDRLIQFKKMGSLQNTTPRKALWAVATKHLTTIMDAVGGVEPTFEDIEHRIVDFINYLILLLAVIKEEKDEANRSLGNIEDREA